MNIAEIAGLTTLAASLAFMMARFFINREKQPKKQNEFIIPQNRQPQQKELYGKLIAKTLGDHGKTKRLIEFERRKNPSASESELIKAAIDRWEQDCAR